MSRKGKMFKGHGSHVCFGSSRSGATFGEGCVQDVSRKPEANESGSLRSDAHEDGVSRIAQRGEQRRRGTQRGRGRRSKGQGRSRMVAGSICMQTELITFICVRVLLYPVNFHIHITHYLPHMPFKQCQLNL